MTLHEALERCVRTKLHASALMFAQTCAELDMPQFGAEIPVLLTVRDEITACLTNPLNQADIIESIKKRRDEIINAQKGFALFTEYQKWISEWIFFHLITDMSKEYKNEPLSGQELFNAHLSGFPGVKNETLIHEDTKAVEEFIGFIPLRMTRAVYDDYLRTSFEAYSFMYSSEDLLSLLANRRSMLSLFDNDTVKEILPEYCHSYARELNDLWTMDLESLSREQLIELVDKLKNISAQVGAIITDFVTAFDALNAALILLSYGNSADISEARLWLTVSSKESKPEFEMQMEDSLNAAVKETEDAERALQKILKNKSEDMLEPVTAYANYKQLHKLYYETALDYFKYPNNNTDENEDDAEQAVEDFIEFAETFLKSFPNRRKRFLRQQLMRNMPFAYAYSGGGSANLADGMRAYEKYFIETYDSLDYTNKQLMAFYVEYFQAIYLSEDSK